MFTLQCRMSGEPLDSGEICGQRETPQEPKVTRRLTNRPVESDWYTANATHLPWLFSGETSMLNEYLAPW